MSDGYVGCQTVTIKEEKIKEFLPEEYQAWESALENLEDVPDVYLENLLLEKFKVDTGEEAYNAIIEAAKIAYNNLCDAFEKRTEVNGNGLRLELFFHGDGDCYDEIEEGPNWCVDGFYHPTPAALAWQNELELTEVSYVEWC